MRGLNIKKIAAVALGTALVGATVAPLVSALDNSSSITKGDVVSLTTGLPTVSLVVGAGAGTSDAVWAGNIAAKIAQLATKDATGGSGSVSDATINLSIGGTTSYSQSDSKTLDDNRLYTEDAGSEFKYNTSTTALGNSSLNFLTSATKSYKWDRDGTDTAYTSATTDITIKEKIGFNVDASFDSQDTYDLIAEMGLGDFYYEIDLGTGIPGEHYTSSAWGVFQNTTGDNIRIPFFGQDYTVQKVDLTGTSKITLIKDSGKSTYLEGQTIEGLAGKGNYAGEDLSIKVVAITQAGGSATYKVKLELYDSEDNLIDTQSFNTGEYANELFQDSDAEYVLDTVFYISDLGLETTSGTGYLTATVGQNVVVLRNSSEYPYDSTNTDSTDDYWTAVITTSGSAPKKITNIKIQNTDKQWEDDEALFAKNYSLTGKTDQYEAIFLDKETSDTPGYGFAKILFEGFKGDLERTSLNIGDDKLTFKDLDGVEREVDFYQQLSINHGQTSDITIAGKKYYYKCYEHDDNAAATTFGLKVGDKLNNYTLAGDDNTALLIAAHTGAGTAAYIGYPKGETIQKVYYDQNSATAVDVWQVHTDYACMFSQVSFDSSPTASDILDLNGTAVATGYNSFTDANQTGGITSDVTSTAPYKYTVYLSSDQNWQVATTPLQFTQDETNETTYAYRLAAYNKRLYLLLDSTTDFKTEYQDKTSALDIKLVGTAITPYGTTTENGTIDAHYYVPKINNLFSTMPNSDEYQVAQFNITGEAAYFGTWTVPIDTESGNVVIPGDNLANWTYKTKYTKTLAENRSFDMATTTRTDFTQAYSDYGVKAWLDEGKAYFSVPESREYLKLVVLGASTTTTVTGGTEFTDLEVGVPKELNNYKVTVTSVGGSASGTYKQVVPVGTMVYQDTAAPAGSHIIVGGYIVNELAKNLVLTDGSSLQEALVSSGDYVVDIMDDGDIVVAGYTANDTATAAKKLISQLESLM